MIAFIFSTAMRIHLRGLPEPSSRTVDRQFYMAEIGRSSIVRSGAMSCIGVCDPQAVKTKPYWAENGNRVVATLRRSPVLTARPPLIACG